MAYSTANSFSVFSPLAPPLASLFPVWRESAHGGDKQACGGTSQLYCERCQGPDLHQLILHFQWPSSLSLGRPSGGLRSRRCRRWTELLLAARSRRSGASVGPCHQTWGTMGDREPKTKSSENTKMFWTINTLLQYFQWKVSFGDLTGGTWRQYLSTNIELQCCAALSMILFAADIHCCTNVDCCLISCTAHTKYSLLS